MAALPYYLGSSRDISAAGAAEATTATFHVTCDTSIAGTVFPAHRHDGDELMWARRGRYDVVVDGSRFALSANQVMWMPAHTPHEAELYRESDLVCLFAESSLRPGGDPWRRPRVLGATSLMTALLEHLTDEQRPSRERERCRELLYCLLEEAPESNETLAVPQDPRAARVAHALLAEPATAWSLVEWATEVGTSQRTLARIFVSQTGLSFGDWRKKARMNAASVLVAAGHPIRSVASEVGYATSSSFIEAFRQVYGTTPAAFRRTLKLSRRA